MSKTLNELAQEIHQNAKDHGWWYEERNIGELLCLVHSEVSEAMEDYRNSCMTTWMDGDKPCGFPSELADVIIRVLDMSAALGIDIEKEVTQKLAYNKTRPYRHGNKQC